MGWIEAVRALRAAVLDRRVADLMPQQGKCAVDGPRHTISLDALVEGTVRTSPGPQATLAAAVALYRHAVLHGCPWLRVPRGAGLVTVDVRLPGDPSMYVALREAQDAGAPLSLHAGVPPELEPGGVTGRDAVVCGRVVASDREAGLRRGRVDRSRVATAPGVVAVKRMASDTHGAPRIAINGVHLDENQTQLEHPSPRKSLSSRSLPAAAAGALRLTVVGRPGIDRHVNRKPWPEPLFDLEAVVMDVVWRHAPISARQVCDRLQGKKQRAYTTIMTTMDRLHRKRLLRREKVGLAWVYTPVLDKAGFEKALADRLADRIIDEHGEVGLAALVDAAATNDVALLERLAELVAARRRRGA